MQFLTGKKDIQEVIILGYVLRHILFATFTIGLGGFFFLSASSMPTSASLFPKLVAVIVLLLSGSMIVQAFAKARNSGTPEHAEEQEQPLHVVRVVVYVVLMVAYIFFIPRIGYFIATPLFMLLSYGWLRALGIARAFLLSIAFSVFIYALFVWFLKLPIPMGVLESLLE